MKKVIATAAVAAGGKAAVTKELSDRKSNDRKNESDVIKIALNEKEKSRQ